jgi:hypothetical protein
MIRMITPLCVSKHPFNPTYFYMLGMVFSTTLIGIFVGTVGTFVRSLLPIEIMEVSIWVPITLITALAYGLHHLGFVSMPMPQNHWQVPAHWIRFGKGVMALLYGVVLGAEVFTLIPYATFYILVLLEFNLGVEYGALIGFVYGIARALPVVLSAHTVYNNGKEISEEVCIVRTENIVEKIWFYSTLFNFINAIALIAVALFLLYDFAYHVLQ